MAVRLPDVPFSPAVRAMQTRMGSRGIYRQVEKHGGFPSDLTPELLGFIAAADSAYLATASAAGQPYVQHRGGPKGFIRVLGPNLLGFADFSGNRQYVTAGNLSENDRAFLFIMDYRNRRRVKLWGRARCEEAPAIVEPLTPGDYAAPVERAILFQIEAWDLNCPRHIPARVDAAEIDMLVSALQDRIDTLEAENAALRPAAP